MKILKILRNVFLYSTGLAISFFVSESIDVSVNENENIIIVIYSLIFFKAFGLDNIKVLFSTFAVYLFFNSASDISNYISDGDQTGRLLGLLIVLILFILGYRNLEKINFNDLKEQLKGANKYQKIFVTIGFPIFIYWLIYGSYWTLYSYNPILYFVTNNPFPLIIWLGCYIGYQIFETEN